VVLASFVIDLKAELARKGNRRIVEVNVRLFKVASRCSYIENYEPFPKDKDGLDSIGSIPATASNTSTRHRTGSAITIPVHHPEALIHAR
jgi:hypothetical protein